jgi:putative MATE family efflux protein
MFRWGNASTLNSRRCRDHKECEKEDFGMSSDTVKPNAFVHGSLGAIYARTALPIIFVMSMNGLQAVIDAVFLGVFVGPEALGAVTLMFPFFMIIIALATLVGSGMSSILSRRLGAGRFDEARSVFAGAHGLALVVSGGLIVLFLALGGPVTRLAAGGSQVLEHLGYVYLRILVLSSPVFFVMGVNVDALRIEGRTGFMAAMSLLVSLANMGFTYVLIVVLGMGVAGSAYGTALAQALALAIILVFRVRGRTQLRPGALLHHSPLIGWTRILALGAPQSLNFLGIALVSASIIAALQLSGSGSYQATVSAYGIITRIMTFVFLPLLGLSQALQAIVGNNYGAEAWTRSNTSLRLGLTIAFVYCIAAECALVLFAEPIGFAFVDDRLVVGEVVRILPVMTAMYFLSGPLVMIAIYFQSIGDAGRAAVLGLAKPYAFVIPMIFLLPLVFGEQGIWMATPVAELLLLGLTTVVLIATARRRNLRWGLFVPVT